MLVEVLLFAALLFLLWRSFRKPPGLPPGPWGLPLVGYVPSSSKSLEEQMIDLHDKHGDIVIWRMGTQLMLFLNSYKLSKEAFSRPEITARPDWEVFKHFEDPVTGVLSTSGALWHNNRKFALRQLRDLGKGKSKLVEMVQEQTLKLLDTLNKEAGTPVRIPHQLFVTIINVIWRMVASTQFDAEDKRLKEFVKIMSDIILAFASLSFNDFLPWLQHVLPNFLFKRLIQEDRVIEMKERFMAYFYEEIERHRATLDPDNPRDLMDSYLLEMEAKKDDPDSTCSDADLANLVLDLFFAGSETTFTTFTWACCYLAAHPEVQRKLHAEIDKVLPKGTLPTLAEKVKMPYTEAVINEVLRISALLNFGVQHMVSNDTELGGYTIPKGTIVSSSVFSIQYDDRHWKRPREFMPERWLDDNGKFTMPKEGFLPFGVGKRVCLGESLARMELFIITTMVFQKFSISPPTGEKINLSPDLRGFFLRKPMDNKFVFTQRK